MTPRHGLISIIGISYSFEILFDSLEIPPC